MKDILKGAPTVIMGDLVEATDPNIKTVRKDITEEAFEFITYCGKRGYTANVTATPFDFYEKLSNGKEVKNVIAGSVSAAGLVYLIARQLKYSSKAYGFKPEELLEAIAECLEEK